MARLTKYFPELFASGCIFTFAVSLYEYVYRIPENRCEMTYMFQWPEYVEIAMPEDVKKAFPRYGLYVYGEGKYAESLRRGEFEGIPILFVPGNAGSHRQVRSLGSVSMTKTERSSQKDVPEFNYFSIDFDEELSGLYGGYLQRQTEYAAKCVRRILSLYKKQRNRPKSLVVVGHSMGGIVARGLFSTQNFSSSLINVLITLASPHAAPVATFDIALEKYYTQISDYWIRNIRGTLENLTVLSIGGGGRDVMVRSDLTKFEQRLKSAVDSNVGGLALFETMAPDVPFVWASTDHLCIVWCKQLVMATVRALFDMAKSTGPATFSQDVNLHQAAIKHHFFDRNDWKTDEKARKAYEIRWTDERRMQQDLWSKLAAVVRYYGHLLPSLCVGYICVFMVFECHFQNALPHGRLRSSVFRIFGFGLISTIFALRIKEEDHNFVSALVAVLMAYGLFSATKVLSTVILAMTRCCRPAATKPGRFWLHYVLLLLTFVLLLLTLVYSWSLLMLFSLIIYTIVIQIRLVALSGESAQRARLIVQTCLVLIGLTGPWTVVAVQNLMHGGTILPHDPSFVPALLWILANLFSMLCRFDGVRRTIIPLVVGLVTIGNCDRLYSTMYCCSVLLGFYSRMDYSLDASSKFE